MIEIEKETSNDTSANPTSMTTPNSFQNTMVKNASNLRNKS